MMIRLATILICLPCIALSQDREPFQAEGSIPQMPGNCYEPADPLLDEGSLEILGMTRGEEFNRYMNDAQAYSFCLERTREMFYDKLRGLIADYETTGQN